MYALEYKLLHIVKEPQRKNCTHQTYRWKQYAVCNAPEPLEAIQANQKHPEEWRVVPMASSVAIAE